MVTVTAHTNIALIKYWGKEDAILNIPTTSSLSMTLDKFYTTTCVEFNDAQTSDTLILNGKEADATRICSILNIFRSEITDFPKVAVVSRNHVPTSAGLASSASSFAALTAAIFKLLEIPAISIHMSRFARRGSGSASRSIFGNFAIWHKGEDNDSSYAESFLDEDIGLSMIVAEVSNELKKIPSSQGMKMAQSAQGYSRWVENSSKQLQEMKTAILTSDIEKIGNIAQSNALAMHELNRTCSEPFDYFTNDTRSLIAFAQQCYKEGILAFATIDAGPNVKILTDHASEAVLLKKFQENFPKITFVIAHSGPGVQYE